MSFFYKLERKFGRFAIKNLTTYIIATFVIGIIINRFAPHITRLFLLEPQLILQGEVWRIISWIFLPDMGLDIWSIIMLFFYYSIGRQLERFWGDFRYNVYIFGGIIFIIISSFVLYFIMGADVIFIMQGAGFSTYYICLSLFWGYAMTCPEQQVLLYFIIPIKMKWMGLISLVFTVVSLVEGTWVTRTEVIAVLLNFVVFFGLLGGFKRLIPKMAPKPKRAGPAKIIPMMERKNGNTSKHRCAVCGRTEENGDDLEFRYCSKCDGDYEYCQDHLYTHEHIKKEEER